MGGYEHKKGLLLIDRAGQLGLAVHTEAGSHTTKRLYHWRETLVNQTQVAHQTGWAPFVEILTFTEMGTDFVVFAL